MSDQGRIQDFPLGGANTDGGAEVWHGCFSAKMCAKIVELGHTGGGKRVGTPLDPAT